MLVKKHLSRFSFFLSSIFIVGLLSCSNPPPQPSAIAYVSNAGNNHIQVIDLAAGETLSKLYTGAAPWRMFLSPDKQNLWINHWYSETTAVVGLSDHDISQVLPYRGPGAFSFDGSQYVTYSWPNPDLYVVDAKSYKMLERRPTEISRIYDLTARHDNAGFYMTRHDPVTKGQRERYEYLLFLPYRPDKHITTPPASYPVGLSPTRITKAKEPFVLTADSETNGVSVVNVLGDTQPVPACPAPKSVILSEDEKRMAVVCWEGVGVRESQIVLFNTDFSARPWPTIEKFSETVIKGGVVAGSFSPVGDRLFVADQMNKQLVELDTKTLAVVRTIPTGDVPTDVIIVSATADQVNRYRTQETSGRKLLKQVLAKAIQARRGFTDVTWQERRIIKAVQTGGDAKPKDGHDDGHKHEGDLTPAPVQVQKVALDPPAPAESFTETAKLKGHIKGLASYRGESDNGVIRVADGGVNISIINDGRFWVTPRQEMLPVVYALSNFTVDEAIRHLAGDIPGSPYMRSGIAVDVVAEVTEGHHKFIVIGTREQGARVPQLWIDAVTGLPSDLVEKFPVIEKVAGHGEEEQFRGIIETKLYDYEKSEKGYLLPARTERVVDGKYTEHVALTEIKTDTGLSGELFDVAVLGGVKRMPPFAPLSDQSYKDTLDKIHRLDAEGKLDEYVVHPFAEREPLVGNPPVAGKVLPFIADWGVHAQPVPLELQLHNLKDGGVAIQYNCPAGCKEIIAQLEKITNSYTRNVLLAPYPLMEAKISLTAWGQSQTMEAVDDTRIRKFIDEHAGKNHHVSK